MDDQRTDREGGGVKLNKPVQFRFMPILLITALVAVFLVGSHVSSTRERVLWHVVIAAVFAVIWAATIWTRKK